MKKVAKWVGVAIGVPLLLILLLALLLYFPPVQNWAVGRVSAYASEKTGMDISVGHVHLEFPLNLGVDDVKVLQPNDSLPGQKDTVADIRKLVVNVQLLPLLKKQVHIDELDFHDVKFNTTDFVAAARVRGRLKRLSLQSHGIDLKQETLRVDNVLLSDAHVEVVLNDSVPPDTTESQNRWKIQVDQFRVEQTDVAVRMPGDSLRVLAHLGKTLVSDGRFDLGAGVYEVDHLDWADGALLYDSPFEKPVEGLDYNHLALSDVHLEVDSLRYSDPKLDMAVRKLAFREKSGINVENLTGKVALDSAKVSLPGVHLRTSESDITADLEMDLNTFADSQPGNLYARLDATVGKQDLMRFMGDMPTGFVRKWPNQPLSVKGVAKGNMQYLDFTGLNVNLPTAMKGTASGYVANLNNPDRLRADIQLDATTHDLDFLTELLDADLRRQIRVPKGMGVKGQFGADGSKYNADFTATEGGGKLKAKVDLNTGNMDYTAHLEADKMPLQHFVPGMGLTPFTGTVEAQGQGTDLLSAKTRLRAQADIRQFSYDGYNLAGMKADATVSNGRGRVLIDSHNQLLNGQVYVDALMNTKKIEATLTADLKQADLHKLHISDTPLDVALCGHVDVATDMKDFYKVQGNVGDITIRDSKNVYRPEDMVIDVLTRRDTTHAVVDCGDFHLDADASGGYKQLMQQLDRILAESDSQWKNRTIDQHAIRRHLPNARIALTSGGTNFFSDLLRKEGYVFDHADVDMRTSPVEGINGNVELTRLVADSMQLDTVRLYVESDSVRTIYRGQIRNNERNPQYTFNALFDGYLLEHGSAVNVKLYDDRNRLGVNLGAEAALEPNGIRVRLNTDNPILGYKRFKVNDDNYVFLSDDRRVSANLNLLGDKGEGVQIYTNDENMEALQDLTVSLNRFDLEKVLSVLPYMPKVTGMMDGDFHLIQTPEELAVSSSLSVDQLTYENCPMGNLSTEFVYMPKDDGSHHIDGRLLRDDEEIGTLVGTYSSEGEGLLDADFKLERLPLEMVNGFIPDHVFGLRGFAEGAVSIKGSLKKPQVNGEVFLDSSYLVSAPYGMELRFANDPVRIVGSHLLFENFEMFSHNENPLNIYGDIDFSNLDHVRMDVKMRAENYQLIDSKENSRSVAYGKAFVNFFGMMSGPLSNLNMRGRLDVLGTTDMGYILRDTPLTTDNQLDELVKFTDFNDTTKAVVNRPPLTGFNMDLSISISQGAHIMAYLNADHSNYIDLMGGGNLRMLYNPSDDLRLNGRYTLSNGEMKYSLPIIPLKTFVIQDGSYLDFTGNPMNPTLNITATESTKATVAGTSGVGRSVLFDCGVIITKTLNDMGLEFTLDAPEDMSLHAELMAMSPEQRGKLAVSLLTTGMYLADGNTSSFSMNSALSSFLNSEINHITGNALRTLDLSFGLDNSTDASGNLHTDYSFKFAKRFWNNRLRIAVGGSVSSGNEMTNQNKSFFDNVSLEYRLDDTANKYVKLFFVNNAYDWLEGYTQEYGGGFIWRRKLDHFWDIFRLKNTQQRSFPQAAPRDTLRRRTPENISTSD